MFRQKPPSQWNVDDVVEWLKSFDFDNYGDAFRKEKITGDFLMKYVNDEEIMAELGITKKVQRKRLEFEIDKLIEQQDSRQRSIVPSSSSRVTRSSLAKRSRTTVRSEEELEESDEECDDEDEHDELVYFKSSPSPKKSSKKQKVGSTPKKTTAKKQKPKTRKTEDQSPKQEMELEELPLFQFEYALSNRSKCRNCEEIIEKSSIKLGVLSFFNRNGRLLPYHSYFHPLCGICIIPPPPLNTSDEAGTTAGNESGDQEVVRCCKFCSRNFSEEQIRQHHDQHTYFFKIGPKRRDLLCHFCAEKVVEIQKNDIRLPKEIVCQIEGYEDTSKENQCLILELLASLLEES